jgi:hypothetical protein
MYHHIMYTLPPQVEGLLTKYYVQEVLQKIVRRRKT